MSKTIDQRVVEMRFDNQQFEKNVSTSMSTLERLKQSLNLSGASKGLENINAAAKNNNISALGAAAEQVGVKFSAMQVMATTAIANLTNSAVNSAKRIFNEFMVAPVTTGFNEYELKMGSIQTIMASTGASLEEVNGYLNELNEYSDKTIYSFQDMTSNIGKFTNAGVSLEDAVLAIKGVSNEAALSGANANEASRAMYNFAQALSAGYVKLIDWKSIENANMATVGFKNELIASAVAAGTLTDNLDGTYSTLDGTVISATQNFNDSLQDQWMTSEVLINTLKNYADETTDIGEKATQAATEVKTFSQMIDTLKESAQSGWAQTWEIIFGDFNQGKSLWTNINNALDGVLGSISDARNNTLTTAFSDPWTYLEQEVSKAGIAVDDFKESLLETAKKHGLVTDDMIKEEKAFDKILADGIITKDLVLETLGGYIDNAEGVATSTEEMNKKLKMFQEVVTQVWKGDFKNGEERMQALADAGYDYAEVQELVNKTVDGHTLTLEDLSDAQLKSVGYTEEEIKKLRELEAQARLTGEPLGDLLERIGKPSGRTLLLEAIGNYLSEFSKITGAVGEAWDNVFGDINVGDGIYNIIEMLHEASESFTITEDKADSFRTIMEGLFAGLQLTTTVFSKSVLAGIKLLDAVLSLFGTDILGVAEKIAGLIIKLRDWAFENTFIGDSINKIAKVLHALIDGVYKCVKAFIEYLNIGEKLSKLRDKLSDIFKIEFGEFNVDGLVTTINNFFAELEKNIKAGKFKEFGTNIIEGLVIGIREGIKTVAKVIKDLALTIINTFTGETKIESPSKVFIALGGFLIAGLVKGILNGEPYLLDVFKNLIGNTLDAVADLIRNGIPYIVDVVGALGEAVLSGLQSIGTIDFGSLFIMGAVVGAGVLANKMINVLDKFATPIEKLGKLVGNIGKVFDETGEAIERLSKAQVWKIRSEALLNLAKALAVLSGSLIAIAIAADHYNLWNAVLVIGALAGILVALSWAMDKMSGASVEINKNGAKIGGFKTGLLIMAASLLVLAMIVKIIGSIDDPKAAMQGFIGLAGLAVVMAGLFAAYGKLVKGPAAENINKAGRMMLGLSVALLLMIAAAKLIAGMEWSEMGKAAVGITGFVVIVAALNLIAMLPHQGIGKMMLEISASLLIMVGVAKLINTMEWPDMGKAAVGILGLVGIIALLMTIAMIPGENIDQIGKTMAGIGAAMLLMAVTGKIIATMEWGDMGKAAAGLLGLSVIVGILVGIVSLVGKDAPKIAATLLALSVSMGILAAIAVVLSMVDVEGLQNGIIAIGALSVIMSLMIVATGLAKDCSKNLVVMTVAIGVMTACVAALSLITPEKLAPATLAMSVLMGIFGVMIKLSSNVNSSMPTLVVMTAAVAIIGKVVYELAKLPVASVIATAASLTVLMLSLATSIKIISGIGTVAPTALIALGVMVAVVGVLALILGGLEKLDCAPSLDTCLGLSVLLVAISAACLLMAALGAVSSLAIAGAVAFDGVVLIIGGLLLAIGALMTYVPGAEEFLDKGIEVLKKIGTGLGEAVGGIINGFLGSVINSLPGYADKLSSFMKKMKGFFDGVGGINSKFTSGMDNLQKGLSAISLWNLGKLTDLAIEISDYSSEAKGISKSAINKVCDVVKTLAKTVASLAGLDTSGAKNLKTAVKNLKNTSINELTRVFGSADSKFKDVGKKVAESLADGITAKSSKISKAAKNVADDGADGAKDKKSAFKSAGKDLGTGLVQGIDAKQNSVYWAGYRLGQAAVQGEKDGQKSASPSKETIKAGKWLGEGLIVGMEKISTKVYNAGHDLGAGTVDSMNSVISRMSAAIDADIDSQPTIRPVLDLSGVQSEARSLDGIFGSSNIGVVSSLMAGRSQNGGVDEVVSAIDKLRKDLGNVGGVVNNINGVTYDDGSNINNAVETIVRAAIRERRV